MSNKVNRFRLRKLTSCRLQVTSKKTSRVDSSHSVVLGNSNNCCEAVPFRKREHTAWETYQCGSSNSCLLKRDVGVQLQTLTAGLYLEGEDYYAFKGCTLFTLTELQLPEVRERPVSGLARCDKCDMNGATVCSSLCSFRRLFYAERKVAKWLRGAGL